MVVADKLVLLVKSFKSVVRIAGHVGPMTWHTFPIISTNNCRLVIITIRDRGEFNSRHLVKVSAIKPTQNQKEKQHGFIQKITRHMDARP